MYLTNPSMAVFAYANGTIPSYVGVNGNAVVLSGAQDVTEQCTFTASAISLTGTVNTADNTPIGAQKIGYYQVTGFTAGATTGSLTIKAVYQGATLTQNFILTLAVTGYEIVATLPTLNLFQGRIVFLTTDNKLYRYTGSAWSALVAATDLTGQLTAAQIASITAAQVTGQLTAAQISSVNAAQLTGTIQTTQIAPGSITTPLLAAGAVSTAQLAAGAVVASTIAAGSITGAQIAGGTIQASNLAAGAIVAGSIAAGSITGAEIAAGTITANNMGVNSITANQVQAGAITAAKLGVNAVTANSILAGSITGNLIAGGTITGANVNATAVLVATSAQIGNLVVGTINLAPQAVTNVAAASGAPKSLPFGTAGGTNLATLTMTTVGGIVVIFAISDMTAIFNTTAQQSALVPASVGVLRDGIGIDSAVFVGSKGGVVTCRLSLLALDRPAAGAHSYALNLNQGASSKSTIVVMELKK
jgi:hypothetical protein